MHIQFKPNVKYEKTGGLRMKLKMIYLTIVCVLLFSISIAEALQYQVLNYPGRQGVGGPFIINPLGPGANFNTFCLETTEYINLNGTYYGTIESYAVYGGAGGNMYTTDPLSIESKKLYDYALDNWASLDITNLTAIQHAIWAYEGEVTYTSLSSLARSYYNQAPSYILDRNIMVLNLWTGDVSAPYSNQNDFNRRAQSMLIQVPEPSTLLLLGAGLLGLGLAVRRRKR
jgi:hypothetical protein